MIFIAHRGNINGPNPSMENNPEYIMNTLKKGYNVKVDLWYVNNKFYLGHNKPDYEIELDFINNKRIWTHIKNIQALEIIINIKINNWKYNDKYYNNIHYFWHQEDDITITSKDYLWVHPKTNLVKNSIMVMPEFKNHSIMSLKNSCVLGICSDNISKYCNDYDKLYM